MEFQLRFFPIIFFLMLRTFAFQQPHGKGVFGTYVHACVCVRVRACVPVSVILLFLLYYSTFTFCIETKIVLPTDKN